MVLLSGKGVVHINKGYVCHAQLVPNQWQIQRLVGFGQTPSRLPLLHKPAVYRATSPKYCFTFRAHEYT